MTRTIGISMSEDDIKRIDQYCMAHNLTRSKFMVQTAIQQIYVADMADGLLLFNKYCSKAANGFYALNEEDSKLLEQAVKLLKGGYDGK